MHPITATDDEIRAYLAEAEVPPLLPALAYVTGDLSLLRDDLRPDPNLLALPQGGLSAAQLATARELAVDALVRFRDGGCRAAPPPRHATICCGSSSTWSAARAWRSTSRCSRRSSRSAATTGAARSGARPTSRPTSSFRVAVIGAGMSGLLTAHRLAPGGRSTSWSSRRTPTSAAPGSRTVSGLPGRQPEPQLQLLVRATPRLAAALLRPSTCCSTTSATAPRDFGLRDHIRFGTEVRSATWDDAERHVDARRPHAPTAPRTPLVAHAVVSAVGQLNRPNFPDIPGVDRFAGVAVPLGAVGPRRRRSTARASR